MSAFIFSQIFLLYAKCLVCFSSSTADAGVQYVHVADRIQMLLNSRNIRQTSEATFVNKGLTKITAINNDVETLNFSKNSIDAISEANLKSIYRVTDTLDLSHNIIAYIHPHAFCNAELKCESSRLKRLYLSHNQITILPPLKLPNLLELDVSNNQLRKINLRVFQGLHKLTSLNVDHNTVLDVCSLFSYSMMTLGKTLEVLYARHTDGSK